MPREARIALLLLLVSVWPAESATIWHVDADAAPGGEGTSWEQALNTIGAATDVAQDGDMILVAPGSYCDPTTSIRTAKSVSLTSTNPDDPDVVSRTIVTSTDIVATSGQAAFTVTGFTISGGGIDLASASVRVTQNVIVGSESRDSKGISLGSSRGLVAHNIIVNHNMGAICCHYSAVTITNNLIVNNSSARYGAGILCEKSSPLIVNNTIVQNVAGQWGGGIYCDKESEPTITNCILWENGDDLYGCSAAYSCISDGDPGQGNFCYFPYFRDPDNGDYRLQPWSPCIDAGDPSSAFGLEPAPNGGQINMGAYGNTVEAACNFADVGEDGLPDEWEHSYFGHLDYGVQDDPDGDGIWNVTEYLFGWDPMSPATALVENVTRGKYYRRIQPAIFEARDGEEIVVFPADYRESINFMGKAITVRSADPLDSAVVASTVIEADTGDVVSFTAGEPRSSVLSGFKLTHPRGIFGRGILCRDSSPTISHNMIMYNTVDMWPGPSEPDVGVAICIRGGSPLVENNNVRGNNNQYGAAVYCEAAEPVIRRNILTQNSARSGALHLQRCPSALIEGNQITNNTGGLAGGLAMQFSHVEVANNLISFNYPAGLYILGGAGLIRGCTIVRNAPAGIATGHGTVGFTVSNCILWENGVALENVDAVYSCVQGSAPGEGNISDDPLFVSPTGGDLRLRANSPCINAGNTAAALQVAVSPENDATLISWSAGEDLDANPRISGRAVDMGAYEYQEGPPDLHFLVEHSSDLKSWESVDIGPAWEWLDDIPDGLGARFYRIGVQ